MPSDKPSSKASEHRRTNKPIMEKKRRARINNCLNELKNLLLEAMRKDPARHTKLEKADILEMTVKYLQSLQRHQVALSVAADPGVVTKYRAGFNECAEEVSRFVGHVDGMDGAVRQRLLGHLANCMNGFNMMASGSSSSSASASDSGSSSVDDASAMLPHLQLIQSRLSGGDMTSLLLPTTSSSASDQSTASSAASWQQLASSSRLLSAFHHHRHQHQMASSTSTSTSSTVSRPDSTRRDDRSASAALSVNVASYNGARRRESSLGGSSSGSGSEDFGSGAEGGSLQSSPTSGSSFGSPSPAASDCNATSDTSTRLPRYRRHYQAYQQREQQQQQEHVFAVPRQSGYPITSTSLGNNAASNNNNNFLINNNNNNNGGLTGHQQITNSIYMATTGGALSPDSSSFLLDYVSGRRDSSLSDLGSLSSEDATGSISSCSGSSRYSSATSAVAMDFSDCEEDLEGELVEEGDEEADGVEHMMPVDLSKDADKMWRPW